MKNLKNLNVTPFKNEEVMKLIKLYQYKGKDFYYYKIMQSDIDSITKQTIEIDCYEIAKYLNLNITDNRKNLIIKKDSNPKTIDEMILKNMKEIFKIIQSGVNDFEFITNDVMSLGKRLVKGYGECSFNKTEMKVQTNIITENVTKSKRNILEEMLKEIEKLLKDSDYEATYLIVNFFIDFINSDLFNIDNKLLGVLLLYLFLYHEGFNLFRYTSFVKLLNENKKAFENAVLTANYNYEEGFSKTAPLQKLIIDMMLKGYEEVELKARDYTYDSALNKSDNIENTIYKLPQVFTKDDIRERHPYTSDSTINRTLQRLRDENIIRPNGVGRSASWIRLEEKEVFNPNYEQMEIFEIADENDNKSQSKVGKSGFDFGI